MKTSAEDTDMTKTTAHPLPACSTGNACPFVVTVRADWATRNYEPFCNALVVIAKATGCRDKGATCLVSA